MNGDQVGNIIFSKFFGFVFLFFCIYFFIFGVCVSHWLLWLVSKKSEGVEEGEIPDKKSLKTQAQINEKAMKHLRGP